jgi:hypothetical protein
LKAEVLTSAGRQKAMWIVISDTWQPGGAGGKGKQPAGNDKNGCLSAFIVFGVILFFMYLIANH